MQLPNVSCVGNSQLTHIMKHNMFLLSMLFLACRLRPYKGHMELIREPDKIRDNDYRATIQAEGRAEWSRQCLMTSCYAAPLELS
jgi:hypothetical protein